MKAKNLPYLVLLPLLFGCEDTSLPVTNERIIGTWECSFDVEPNIELTYKEMYSEDGTYRNIGIITFLLPYHTAGKAQYEISYDGTWKLEDGKRIVLEHPNGSEHKAIDTEQIQVTEQLEFMLSFMPDTSYFDVDFPTENTMIQKPPETSKYTCSKI
ncbi:MAG: hypothetical protein R3309_05735 [Reinekea sp.]|nr:hypothetical protein [Reinekea sp.]